MRWPAVPVPAGDDGVLRRCAAGQTNQASALINVARNIGGSMGVALAQTVLAQRASDAASQAVAWVGQTLQRQVDFLAYIDVFWTLAVIGALMIPLALSMRSIDLNAPAGGH
ncbi:hypothetical protein ACVJGD_001442 [Bradyrhizobium sp. USDA 10063]